MPPAMPPAIAPVLLLLWLESAAMDGVMKMVDSMVVVATWPSGPVVLCDSQREVWKRWKHAHIREYSRINRSRSARGS